LKRKYGRATVPQKCLFAKPHSDGAGADAYKKCMKPLEDYCKRLRSIDFRYCVAQMFLKPVDELAPLRKKWASASLEACTDSCVYAQ